MDTDTSPKSNHTKPSTRWWIGSLLATLVFSTIVAVIVTLLADYQPPMVSFIVSYSIGMTVLFFEFLGSLLSRGQGERELYIVITGLIGMVVGLVIAGGLAFGLPLYFLLSPTSLVIALIALVAAVVYVVYVLRLQDSRLQIETLEQNQLRQEKQLVEANLRNLQNQVQPHFLFNTLANVQSNIKQDPDKSIELLSKLSDFLRVTLKTTTNPDATLNDELNTIQTYLDVQAMRMGPRLTYTIQVAERARDIRISPLLLQPLVENVCYTA